MDPIRLGIRVEGCLTWTRTRRPRETRGQPARGCSSTMPDTSGVTASRDDGSRWRDALSSGVVYKPRVETIGARYYIVVTFPNPVLVEGEPGSRQEEQAAERGTEKRPADGRQRRSNTHPGLSTLARP